MVRMALPPLCVSFIFVCVARNASPKNLFGITRERSLTRPETKDPLINVTKLVSGRERRALSFSLPLCFFFASYLLVLHRKERREEKKRESSKGKTNRREQRQACWFAFEISLMIRKIERGELTEVHFVSVMIGNGVRCCIYQSIGKRAW